MAPEKAPAFQFYPADWLIATMGLSLAEQGRLFTQIARAVAGGDREAVKQWLGGFIGRVYWREKPNRPFIHPAVKREVFERDGGRCRSCFGSYRIEFDHVIPFSRGGPDTVENLQLLCKKCNRRKAATVG